MPKFAQEGDAGFDLFCLEDYQLKPQERHTFLIGISSQIPTGYSVIVKPKSGLAVKRGIDVLAGVIDSGYRGEWGIVLINFADKSYQFKKGDKIAQGLLVKLPKIEIRQVSDLDSSQRGQGGFGSTGRR